MMYVDGRVKMSLSHNLLLATLLPTLAGRSRSYRARYDVCG